MKKMSVLILTLFSYLICASGQMIDPYMLYGGGAAMYGGLNPYLYNGMANYGAYNQPNLMYNPYQNMDLGMQSAMLANYNALNAMGVNGLSALNPTLGTAMNGFGNSNVLDSGNTINGLNSLSGGRGYRNRLPTLNRDIGIPRMQSNSMFGCGIVNSRPCGSRNVGAGTQWENSHDNRRR